MVLMALSLSVSWVCLRSSGLVFKVVGELPRLLRLVTSLVSELSHLLMECLSISLLLPWTFRYRGLQELNDLKRGASSRLSSAELLVSVSVSAWSYRSLRVSK